MFSFNKKSGFTLAEILITLGLIGAVSAITIPTLAYNYRAKVLEEQYRSTYSDLKQIGAMINYEKGDVGEYANKVSLTEWEKELTGRLNGGGKLESSKGVNDIYAQLGQYYKNGGGSPGPYYFHLKNSQLENVGAASKNYICDNGQMYVDSKGRVWTFNSENRIICVDINGAGNPNRYNMDIFAFVPMSARMSAIWVHDDPSHPENYSGEIVPCDIDSMHRDSLGNRTPAQKGWSKGSGSALDHCPFFGPIENVAPTTGYYNPGKSAKGRDVTSSNNYWKDYINYK